MLRELTERAKTALGIQLSIKTVEVHRARVMEKMHAKSVAELVQAILAAKSVG